MNILYCEDSLEGVFTAIYLSYEMKLNHDDTHIRCKIQDNYELFAEYYEIESDDDKSMKVGRTIIKEFGNECFSIICKCLASYNYEKSDSVYHMIVYGLSQKRRHSLMNDLANNYVNKVFVMSRETNNELLHLRGFLRFEELENGVLFSKIAPKNNIVTLLTPHFADRFPNENFIIYDEIRRIFVIHPAFKQWFIVSGEYMDNINLILSDEELIYSKLFMEFCKTIAIKERRNINLQTQMLPLRFQKYMTEFK